jgi:hypothetical protein
MEFMLVFYQEEGVDYTPVMPEMGKFAGELAEKGQMRGGAPLHPISEAARIRVDENQVSVTDGPFAETKEIIGGYFMVDCASRAEAIEIAKRCPHARLGLVEVRQVIPVGGPPAAASS